MTLKERRERAAYEDCHRAQYHVVSSYHAGCPSCANRVARYREMQRYGALRALDAEGYHEFDVDVDVAAWLDEESKS